MATLTVGSGDFMRAHRGDHKIRNFPEGASQTFKRGYPVIFSAVSNKEYEIIVWTADLTTGIIGVAQQDASGTEGTSIPVLMASPDAEFRAPIQSGGTIDYTDLSKQRGLVIDTTNTICRVDLSETVAKIVTITDLVVGTDGDINATVAFKFMQSTLAFPA